MSASRHQEKSTKNEIVLSYGLDAPFQHAYKNSYEEMTEEEDILECGERQFT